MTDIAEQTVTPVLVIYFEGVKTDACCNLLLFSQCTVIPRYIALHLSRLRCFAEFFTVNPDWLRGFTVV